MLKSIISLSKLISKLSSLVAMVVIGGCFSFGPPDSEPQCKSNDGCADGWACIDQKCAAPCTVQTDCTSEAGKVCFTGYCVDKVSGTAPTLDSVTGNAEGVPSQVKDGFLIAGSQLGTAEFELNGDGWSAPLTVKDRNDTSAQVVWSKAAAAAALPNGAHQGSYELVATNRSGSALVEVALQLPDYSGDDLVSRINTQATTAFSNNVMAPELLARVAALEAEVVALKGSAPITQDLTVNVPENGTCDDIVNAIRSLEGRAIASTATVKIQVPMSGSPYQCTKTLEFALSNGSHVQFLGGTAAAPVVLNFAGVGGVYIGHGYTLGRIGGFRLVGTKTPNTHGIMVSGGRLTLDEGIEVAYFGGTGVAAEPNATLIAPKLNVHHNGDGISASDSSYVLSLGSTSDNNGYAGFSSHQGGVMYVSNSTASGNTKYGFLSEFGSYMTAVSTKATGNATGGTGGADYGCFEGAIILAPNTSTNGSSFYPAINTVAADQGFIHAS